MQFTATNMTVGEGEGAVNVCISVDTLTATPISLLVEAVESTPISAEGMTIAKVYSHSPSPACVFALYLGHTLYFKYHSVSNLLNLASNYCFNL